MKPATRNRTHGGGMNIPLEDRGKMKSYLPDSVYMWACGEKAENQVDELAFSDILIGWLNLLIQGILYLALVLHGDEPDEDASYSVAAVTGAMYLLIATTAPDLQAGYSLLVHGASPRHRVFGAALLALFGLLVAASMKVLFSSAEDDATILTSSVTILFVADLDEKALSFHLTLAQKWRLFWATNMVGISSTLALAGIAYVGKAPVGSIILSDFPSWVIFAVNTAAVTCCSYILSTFVLAVSEARAGDGTAGPVSFRQMSGQSIHRASMAVREEPCVCVVLLVWLATGARGWWTSDLNNDIPVGLALRPDASAEGQHNVELTENHEALIVSSVALFLGFVMCVLNWVRRFPPPKIIDSPVLSREISSRISSVIERSESSLERPVFAAPRVSSVLLGWGIGYWVTSTLYLLCSSWEDGGWDGAPRAVTIIGYVLVPLFFVAGTFLVAHANILGRHLGKLVESSVDTLKDRNGVIHWMMLTVLRDVVLLWFHAMFVVGSTINIL